MSFHDIDARICERALATFRRVVGRAEPDDFDHAAGLC